MAWPLGDALRAARRARKMSQSELAKRTRTITGRPQCCPSMISNIETGAYRPSRRALGVMIASWAEALDIDAAELAATLDERGAGG